MECAPRSVLSGPCIAQLDPDPTRGFCVYDGGGPSGDYGSNEACVVRANTALIATAAEFATEAGYDKVRIHASEYSGAIGPSNVHMTAGNTLTWSSDNTANGPGFAICASTRALLVGLCEHDCQYVRHHALLPCSALPIFLTALGATWQVRGGQLVR